MAEKMLIIIISGEKDKTKAMMGLTLAAHLNADTKVIFFGESEKLAASEDPEIGNLIKNLQDKNIIPIAFVHESLEYLPIITHLLCFNQEFPFL